MFCTPSVAGSPPRMREKLTSFSFFKYALRITPAYAGKTYTFESLGQFSKDHPRVCGKNICRQRPKRYNLGSPPRMREKPAKNIGIKALSRITPAYAGKTLHLLQLRQLFQDHPRVCGKNTKRSQ